MSTVAWTNLPEYTRNLIVASVRAILKPIRRTIRHGKRQGKDLTKQAWDEAKLQPLISLLAYESYHPNPAAKKAKAVVRAYERIYDAKRQQQQQKQAVAAAAAATAAAAKMTENVDSTAGDGNNDVSTSENNDSSNHPSVSSSTSSSTSSSSSSISMSSSASAPASGTCCQVCFGHWNAAAIFLKMHERQCRGLPRENCHYVCDICRTTTQLKHHVFQCETLKDHLQHLSQYHRTDPTTQNMLCTQRFECDCKRMLLGKDFIRHPCRGSKGLGGHLCYCKYVLPSVKKQHHWNSESELQTHVMSGTCAVANVLKDLFNILVVHEADVSSTPTTSTKPAPNKRRKKR